MEEDRTRGVDRDAPHPAHRLLNLFEQLSGLKINFHKSEIFCYGAAKESEQEYERLFGCKIGNLPFKYLGIPMHHRRLSNKDWGCIEEKFQKKLSSWKGKLLSYGGRLVLVNSVLSSLVLFMMSFFEVPRGVLKRLDYYRSRFFWQCDDQKKKYRLAKWSILCTPKEYGGLGILNLDIQNKCLLSKWLFKLLNKDGVWQTLLRRKYLSARTLTQVKHRPGDSHFWSGLLKVKDDLLAGGSFKVQNGKGTRFWEDVWIGEKALSKSHPNLYRLARRKDDMVANVLRTIPLNVSFRRGLSNGNLASWIDLVSKVAPVCLSNCRDHFLWNASTKGKFTVGSMYNLMISRMILPEKNDLWKLRIPLKIKIFLWFLRKGVTLTKDNLAKVIGRGMLDAVFATRWKPFNICSLSAP